VIARLAAAVALGAALIVPFQATAAARACNVITDPAGDANDPLQTGEHPHPALSNANLDILGGDFAATPTTVTGVIKLAKAPSLDLLSPQGDTFYLEFQPSVSPYPLYLRAGTDLAGDVDFSAGTVTVSSAGGLDYTPNDKVLVKGKVTGSTITMTATTAALRPLVKLAPKARINGIMATSYGSVYVPDTAGLLIPGDTTNRAKPFIAGTPSCVAPVR
jgi:hypothetical protein